MFGLRVLQVTSMPGQNGPPTQFPTLASDNLRTMSRSGGTDVVNFPAAHCDRKKYCVCVSVRNLSIITSLTELLPELRGIKGNPVEFEPSEEKSWLFSGPIAFAGPEALKSAR